MYSYSDQDELFKDELHTALAALRREGAIDVWQDRQILPGSEFDRDIGAALEASDVIILLVSKYFIASDYCWSVEMKRAIERHVNGTAAVVPVILRRELRGQDALAEIADLRVEVGIGQAMFDAADFALDEPLEPLSATERDRYGSPMPGVNAAKRRTLRATTAGCRTDISPNMHRGTAMRWSGSAGPIGLRAAWRDWKSALVIVTDVSGCAVRPPRWWRGIAAVSRGTGRAGRPQARAEFRRLVREVAVANPLWRAPRIHAELLKAGIHDL
jgi:hypothetical protein